MRLFIQNYFFHWIPGGEIKKLKKPSYDLLLRKKFFMRKKKILVDSGDDYYRLTCGGQSVLSAPFRVQRSYLHCTLRKIFNTKNKILNSTALMNFKKKLFFTF